MKWTNQIYKLVVKLEDAVLLISKVYTNRKLVKTCKNSDLCFLRIVYTRLIHIDVDLGLGTTR